MALNLVTGGLGTGKSYWMVRRIYEALMRGNMVVTNFRLEDDALEKMAFRGPFHDKRKPSNKRWEKLIEIEKNFIHVRSLEELMRVRIRQEEPFCTKKLDKHGEWTGEWRPKEGVIRVFLDEAHRWMNAREWTAGDRKEILSWFALSRKRGMEIFLGTQDAQNIDRQVRSLFEDHIKLNNLRRSARFLGMRVIPFNCFVALKVSAHYPKEIAGRDVYLLNWCKKLYDTMDTESFSVEGDLPELGAIWLPRSEAEGKGLEPHVTDGTPPAAREDGGPPAAPVLAQDLPDAEWGDPELLDQEDQLSDPTGQ